MKWKLRLLKLALTSFLVLLQWPITVYAEQGEPQTAVFPKPDGRYQIGFHQFEITEHNKWIQVSAWYPSGSRATGERATYVIPAVAKVLQDKGFPETEYQGLPPSWSFVDLPTATGKHPVLIYNHGFSTFPRQSMTRFEYLASHGYITLALGHPEDTMAIERETGEVIVQLAENAFQAVDEADLATFIAGLKRMSTAKSQIEWQDALGVALKTQVSNTTKRFDTWYANNMILIRAFDKIQSGAISTPLQNHLDLEAIASFGHSYGGNVSVILANKNPAIKVSVNLDGALFNWTMNEKRQVPTCFFYANQGESYPGLNDSLFNDTIPVCSLTFNDANHMSFTDLTYTMADESGKVNGYPIGQEINRKLKDYFDTHLKQANRWPPEPNENIIQK
ncbi:alpha/beta hydrolase [Photobacterium atrarenae]|uniref:Platelet-activating factor acetylhydrolase n=1 Tax=Photobacterium atrarenae TaxID=865757 RepID=A0ABY5GLU8_9GAMM|nr:hypothetical protein [Photobacterium atrarenae]UTV29532.1 hypothetical protein NNL38_21170 [Photobacterium atrarenae]